jgi:hypothetical protein
MRYHDTMQRLVFCCLSLLLFSQCQSPKQATSTLMPGDAAAPSQVTPNEALALAQKYTQHAWRPFGSNLLHGTDEKGIWVNTPDAGFTDERQRSGWWEPGVLNTGIPYKWGGFDDPQSFDQAVALGHAAGDVSSAEKRRLDNAGVSQKAAGVDCSGFVSRCLKLPRVYDTTQLPDVCDALPSARDLRPGDLLNLPRGHVLLIAGWAGADQTWIYYYETGGPPDYWRPGLKQAPLESLLALGYTPLRYRGMAHEPGPSGKEVLTRSARSQAVTVKQPVVGEP